MFDARSAAYGAYSFSRYMGLVARSALRKTDWAATVPQDRPWWRRPGYGVMYQIEARPGWAWDRDYEAFNRSLAGPGGRLAFDGPRCDTAAWVRLSAEIGADYHSFEAKWHDGICWFDTASTAWKTPTDYAGAFAEASRAAGIPFQYYYSAVFDHNPQFDAIQPNRRTTPSYIGRNPAYLDYLRAHYEEIQTKYGPDGMWFDWYWPDPSTEATIAAYRERYAGTPFTFNLSNLFPAAFGRVPVTSSEAHRYDGPWVVFRKEAAVSVPVLTSAVKWSNAFRQLFAHPWELCTPAGRWWQDPRLREDPLELLRSVAVVAACGGKLHVGATAQMNGDIFADQVTQLRMLGEWYRPRKRYFTEAAPIAYKFFSPPGVTVEGGAFDLVASRYGEGVLLHLVNRTGKTGGASVALRGAPWNALPEVTLVPQGRRLAAAGGRIDLTAADVDPVDTLLLLRPTTGR